MSVTRRDMKHMAGAVVALVAVVMGVSAVASGGLTWAGAVGALLAALYASAVVVAAIAFYSAYRRHNPLPAVKPQDRLGAQTPSRFAYPDDWLDSEEGLEERPEPPVVYAREERESPPP